MICLAWIGMDEAMANALSPRLHGAVVRPSPSFDHLLRQDYPYSGVLIGSQLDTAEGDAPFSRIAALLSAKKNVALTQADSLNPQTLDRLTTIAQQNSVQFVLLNPDRYLPSRQRLPNNVRCKSELRYFCDG